ncbi:MAG: endonuclease III [Verrucomicrobiota bacterium]|nr:endonuclease III [Verrucomicrobiota bacterium]
MAKRDPQSILLLLKKTYPNAYCELTFSNPLELLIATILSAQCTDKRVNIVTPHLFAKFSTVKAIAEAPIAELEKLVQSTGFYKNKARNIKACCQQLVSLHKGEVPQSMEELHALPGVGRKTANVVLGNAFNISEGIVVDTHIGRLSRRFKFTKHTDPVKIEQDLIKVVPKPDWTTFCHQMIWHGRRRCYARKPDCTHCELAGICPSFGKV